MGIKLLAVKKWRHFIRPPSVMFFYITTNKVCKSRMSSHLFAVCVQYISVLTLLLRVYSHMRCAALHYDVLRCTVVCCTIMCCAVTCCTIMCCTVMCCAALHSDVLCCAALWCAALWCAMLWCAALWSAALMCCTALWCAAVWRAVLHCTRSSRSVHFGGTVYTCTFTSAVQQTLVVVTIDIVIEIHRHKHYDECL